MCDIFVALPPTTADGCVVFGKNSDRPSGEVQEVIHVPASDHDQGSKVKCTYIEIDQVAHTAAIIISRPAWLWGAEMGANEHGVCVGNVAVWTKLNGPEDLKEKLLGMDLVRLSLERSKSARHAVDVITDLIAQYGQGGPCSEMTGVTDWAYHNSFLMADRNEAWLLETAGKFWAAEKVTGIRNLSNELTIETKIDLMSPNLIQEATDGGFYKESDGPFNFCKVFSDNGGSDIERSRTRRYINGKALLTEATKDGKFGVEAMCTILRDEDSGINMKDYFRVAGSQVSVLPPPDASAPPCHWFTATPDPAISLYKPFIFCPGAKIGDIATSPSYGDEDPARVVPRFQRQVDRKHLLSKGHDKLEEMLEKDDSVGHGIVENLRELENKCMEDMAEMMTDFNEDIYKKVSQIFLQMCNFEMNFYRC